MNLYTTRDRLIHTERHTPQHGTASLSEYQHRLNAHGRHQPRGHRTNVTPSVLLDRLPELLTGGMGLGPQIAAYRRIAHLKAKTPGRWTAATSDILTDLAQSLDPVLERSRAQRIAAVATPAARPMVQGWLDGESL